MTVQNATGPNFKIPRHNQKPLIVLLAIFGLVTFTYSLLLPLGEAADEFEHFALIRFIAQNKRPPLTLKEQLTIGAKGDASPLYHTLVALLTQHVDVSALPDLPDPRYQINRAIPNDRLPFKGLYHTQDEAFPFRGIVLAWHLARLVSIPLGVATIFALYTTVLAVAPNRPYFALAAAGVAAFIPRFGINSAIVSDDNLVLPLIAFALYYLVRICRGDTQRHTFITLGVLMGLAAVAKYHSLLLVPEFTVVLALLAWQNRWRRELILRRWGVTMLAFLLAAGWWFAFLLIQFNQVDQLGWLRGLMAPLGDPVIASSTGRLLSNQAANLAYEAELGWPEWAWLLCRTFWFRYGRGHVINTLAVNWSLAGLTLVAVVGLVAAGVRHRRQLGQLRRWRPEITLLALHFLTYLSIVVIRYLTLPTRETAQGRHLYPTLTAIAFFLILGLSQALRLLPHLRPRIHKWMAAATGSLFVGLSLLTLPLFIMPVYYPYLPIRRSPPEQAPIQHPLTASFAGDLQLAGYSLSNAKPQVGDALPVTLYWEAQAPTPRDYLVKLCLHDGQDEPVACRLGHPADGRYPTRAWEAGYLVSDAVNLPTPRCLPAGSYRLKLSVLPLRVDTAATTIDETIGPEAPLLLGKISLAGGQPNRVGGVDLWVGNTRYPTGQANIEQLRRALTLIHYGSPAESAKITLSPANNSAAKADWQPLGVSTKYTCPNGGQAATHHFIADPAVRPATYTPTIRGRPQNEPLVRVLTRARNFTPPDNLPVPVNARFGNQLKLLGYGVDLSPRRPGDTLEIDVHWQALQLMEHRYVGSVHLLDHQVEMWGQIDHVLGNDFEYPNILWAPGQVVRQVFNLPIRPQTPPGLYTIEFGVYHKSSGNFNFLPISVAGKAGPAKQLDLGQVRVVDPARSRPPASGDPPRARGPVRLGVRR